MLVPHIGELAGVWSPTFSFHPDGVHMTTGALRGSQAAQAAIAIFYVSATITFAGWLGYRTRQSERLARDAPHLQSWHLRHLVPA